MDLNSRAPEDDDNRRVVAQDHTPVVVGRPEPCKAEGLGGQGRGCDRSLDEARRPVNQKRRVGEPPGVDGTDTTCLGLQRNFVRVSEVRKPHPRRAQAVHPFDRHRSGQRVMGQPVLEHPQLRRDWILLEDGAIGNGMSPHMTKTRPEGEGSAFGPVLDL